MNFGSVLGRCRNENEVGCIVSVESGVPGEGFTSMSMIGGGDTYVPEDSALSIPRGASQGVWQASDGTAYTVGIFVEGLYETINGRWATRSAKMNAALYATIQRVPRVHQLIPPSAVLVDMDGKKALTRSGGGTLESPIVFSPERRFRLTFRVPTIVTGWFQARLRDPAVSARLLSSGRAEYSISGEVSRTLVAGGVAGLDDPKWPMPWKESSSGGSTFNPALIRDYERWEPFLFERALQVNTEWAFASAPNIDSKCFDASRGMAGVVSSNASSYSTDPPTFSDSTGSLDYKVAAPHLNPSGEVAAGEYALSISLEAVKCLYSTSRVPNAAQLTISYNDGSSPYTVVQSVRPVDGWLNASVTGFHYSSPTISTTLGVVQSDANSNASQNFRSLLASFEVNATTPSTAPARQTVRTVLRGSTATLTISLSSRQTVKIYRKVGRTLTLLRTLAARKGINRYSTTYRRGFSFVVKDAKGRVIAPSTKSSSMRISYRFFS